MLRRILPYLIFGLYRLLKASWRIEIQHSNAFTNLLEQKKSFVVAHWHGDELAIVHLIPVYDVCVITSTSKDGDLVDKVVQLLGGHSVRGSSTRGGFSAVRGILRMAKQGLNPGVAVDGPKGPIYKVKAGVFEISKLTRLPIVPLAAHAESCWISHKSWNKTFLAKPFSRVSIYFGDPLPGLSPDEDPHSESRAQALEISLHYAKQHARESLAGGNTGLLASK